MLYHHVEVLNVKTPVDFDCVLQWGISPIRQYFVKKEGVIWNKI